MLNRLYKMFHFNYPKQITYENLEDTETFQKQIIQFEGGNNDEINFRKINFSRSHNKNLFFRRFNDLILFN